MYSLFYVAKKNMPLTEQKLYHFKIDKCYGFFQKRYFFSKSSVFIRKGLPKTATKNVQVSQRNPANLYHEMLCIKSKKEFAI